jgi:hypothetical protein
MDMEERIAKWERVTLRLAVFATTSIILLVAFVYSLIEGIKFLLDRAGH